MIQKKNLITNLKFLEIFIIKKSI